LGRKNVLCDVTPRRLGTRWQGGIAGNTIPVYTRRYGLIHIAAIDSVVLELNY
jgi:hypothetical protein